MRITPASRIFAVAVALASGLTACGGGGGGSSGPIPPAISNLTYAPTTVDLNSGGGTGTVTGSFSYTDTNGGLVSVTLVVSDSSGATVSRTTSPVPSDAPPSAGTLQGSVTFSTTVAGDFAIHVTVTDLAGLVSNELTGGFRIAPAVWVSKASMPIPQSTGFIAATTGGRRVYVIGGVMNTPEILQIYDTATDSWTIGPAMPRVHGPLAVAVALNGVVYVMGGFDVGTQAVLSSVDAFDTAGGIWSTKTPMPTPRHSAAGAVINGRICIVGGYNGGTIQATPALNSVECYDPVANSWSAGPPMPTARMRLGFDVAGESAYAVGGVCCFGPGFPHLATVERYDAGANAWSTSPALPTVRNEPAVVGAGGLLFVIGGYGGTPSGLLTTVEAYDPTLGAWKTKSPTPTALSGPRAVQVNGVIYAFDQQGQTLQYDPMKDVP
jgi:hypothetical protein